MGGYVAVLLKLLQRWVRRPCAILKFDASSDIFAGGNHCLIIHACSHNVLEKFGIRQAVYRVEVVDGLMASFNNHEPQTVASEPRLAWSYTCATETDIWTQTDGILGNLGTPEYPAYTPPTGIMASPWQDLGRDGRVAASRTVPAGRTHEAMAHVGRHSRSILLNPSFAPRSVGISCVPCAVIFSSVFSRGLDGDDSIRYDTKSWWLPRCSFRPSSSFSVCMYQE